MNYFYISSMSGNSGVSKYASVFYEHVLRPRGYAYIDSNDNLTSIFTKVSSIDDVHIEIGIFQVKEIQILMLMLKANYKNVSVTLHDAPLLKFPLKSFKNNHLNKFSKFYDRYISRFRNSKTIISKIKTIYVLTEKGLSECIRIYKTNNFRYLPHIVETNQKKREDTIPNRNFLYLGFIGKNKGIEYALKLHAKIIKHHPDIHFYVLGTALGKQIDYYHYLKSKYIKNVHFYGYVDQEDLAQFYGVTRFAFLLFKDYKYYFPASGSILNCMNQGKIILTNQTKAIPEIIKDGENGLFLTGELKKDILKMYALFEDKGLQLSLTKKAMDHLKKEHNKIKVSRYFFRDELKLINVDSYQ